MTPVIANPPLEIEAFCRKWKVSELSLFGSALRSDFHDQSDIDLLVSFSPDARWSLLDMVTMEDELRAMFQREVDLIDRRAIEQSENYIRRRQILGSALPIYVAK